MALSWANTRLERAAVQITGSEQGKTGVYVRLLEDSEKHMFIDIRWFRTTPTSPKLVSTSRGLIFNKEQATAIINAMNDLLDEAEKQGMQ